MRVLIRTSRWAIWSRRLAAFALPVLVFSVLLHRLKMLDTSTFLLVLGLASFLAFLGLATGLIAYFRLWHTGDRGWGRATLGILISLICLVPAGYAGFLFVRYPYTNEVTTDWTNPPELITTANENAMPRGGIAQIVAAFPNAVTRIYPIDAPALFDSAAQLMVSRGWQILSRREPNQFGRAGQVNATSQSLFGFVDEISVVVLGTREGAKLDIRSASVYGADDLGANGTRIEAFLVDLDDQINEAILARQAVSGVPDEEDAPANPVPGSTD
ncbi:MAG: DUF1499 domain-containing protein [Hyphomicrobiaceae bacterium]|nr:DUF1499 domain-containing protein [Hyphomicrobiaceae bacterium]